MTRSPEGPALRRDRTQDRRLGPPLVLVLAIAAALLVGLWWWPAPPAGVLIEVVGEVPRPGWHRLRDPTLASALQAAGSPDPAAAATPLHEGDRVVVGAAGVRVLAAGDPLLLALPVDVNTADPTTLATVPGIGHELAAAIIEDRARRGPFYELSDLARVRGVGGGTVDALAPMITVGPIGPRPPPAIYDLNEATAEELIRLPGIGPVSAQRIVEDRARRGPFRSVDDLVRVKGIGPSTVEKIRARVRVEPTPSGVDIDGQTR